MRQRQAGASSITLTKTRGDSYHVSPSRNHAYTKLPHRLRPCPSNPTTALLALYSQPQNGTTQT